MLKSFVKQTISFLFLACQFSQLFATRTKSNPLWCPAAIKGFIAELSCSSFRRPAGSCRMTLSPEHKAFQGQDFAGQNFQPGPLSVHQDSYLSPQI